MFGWQRVAAAGKHPSVLQTHSVFRSCFWNANRRTSTLSHIALNRTVEQEFSVLTNRSYINGEPQPNCRKENPVVF